LCGGNAAGCSLPAATGLGFTGFFFPLFQPMLRMGGNPAIRQQGSQGGGVAGAVIITLPSANIMSSVRKPTITARVGARITPLPAERMPGTIAVSTARWPCGIFELTRLVKSNK
jgi:hypothetical protein